MSWRSKMNSRTGPEKNARIENAWDQLRDSIEPGAHELGCYAFEQIAEGRSVTIESAGRGLNRPAEEARKQATFLVRRGLLTVDDSGSIIGALGLTTEPTQYRLLLNGRALFTWCALDAVGIPAALGADAIVQTTIEGRPFEVRLQRGRLAAASRRDVRISLPDPQMDVSIRQSVCPEIRFHLESHAPQHPGVALLSLDEAMDSARRIWGKTPSVRESGTDEDFSMCR